jgi:hypothetical protein
VIRPQSWPIGHGICRSHDSISERSNRRKVESSTPDNIAKQLLHVTQHTGEKFANARS